jgi:hypothetical protein
MTTKSFFSDQECRDVGFSEPMIRTLKQLAEFVDAINRIADAEAAQEATNTAVDALAEAQEDANVTLGTLDTRLDAIEVLQPFVRQDQTTAWADATGTLSRATFAAYAGQTVSNPPTQAQVQAIDNQVKSHSQRLAALVNDLRAIGALT